MNKKKQVNLDQHLKAILQTIPKLIGVYKLINKEGDVIYIGKANNLYSRIRDHFFDSKPSLRVLKMRQQVDKVDYTVVANEVEALVLEANLIKELQPKYNILLRDDKSFIFIKVTIKEDFPRVFLVRRPILDGSKYFGPKTNSRSARKIVDLLQKIYKFRICNYEIIENEQQEIVVKKSGAAKLPCIEYHIHKCEAPCTGTTSKIAYHQRIESALSFLKGETKSLVSELKREMTEAATQKKFEVAAKYRDLLHAVEQFSQKQIVAEPSEFEADIIGICEKFDHVFLHLFQIREGKIIASENIVLPLGESVAESFYAFLREYLNRGLDLPKIIVVDRKLFPDNSKKHWEEYCYKIVGHKIELFSPVKGRRKQLLDLAENNAFDYARRNAPHFMKVLDENIDLNSLKTALNLSKIPRRIEAYDISHLSGTETVGSMVVFKDGKPSNAHYRKFKIRSLKNGQIDDFLSMREVISRRLKHIPRQLPDDFVLQKIAKKDIVDIKKIAKKHYWTDQMFDSANIYVLKKGDKIVGFGGELICGKDDHLLLPVVILKSFKTKKYSEFLINKLIEKSQGKKLYFIAYNKCYAQFMEELGFEKMKIIKASLLDNLNECLKNKSKTPADLIYLVKQKKKKDESFDAVPDLILIDGGKGQLSAAIESLSRYENLKKIHICALAKREEEIYLPDEVKAMPIDKNSTVSLLLQRVRDEAHRFALSFNRNLREKKRFKGL